MVSIVQEQFTLRNDAGGVYVFAGPCYVIEHDGLGLSKPRRVTRKGPQQHGQTLSNALLVERVISLKLHLQCTSEAGIRVEREAIEQVLAQINKAAYLDVTLPSGDLRRLDVYFYDGMQGARTAEDLYYTASDVLQLIADTPVAYDPVARVETFGLSGGGTGTPVPTAIPMTVGASTVDATKTIAYPGTWESLPIIRAKGPITDLLIENLTTGEKLDFDGATIAAGDWYDIDLRYGEKTVVDAAGASHADELSDDSDQATFHLAAPPEAVGGNNDIRVTGSGVTSATEVIITYYVRYWGVV